jgi:2-haloacid dehalogenase
MNRWITFDCYGTLIDWRTGMRNSLDMIAPGHGAALLELHRKIEGQIEMHEPYRPYREVLAESVRRMCAERGAAIRPGDEQVLASTLAYWPLYADTNAALQALKAQGWKLAILSNVDRDLIAGTLRHFEVAFDLVITAEDVRSYKPAPAHAQRFLDITGVAAGDWLYAAVSLQYDLVQGQRLGAQCAWINRDRESAADSGFLRGNLAGMMELPALAATL